MVEVRKFEGIAEEKDRCVITHKVPVTLLSIELHGKASDVPFGIGSAALAGHGGKTKQTVGLFAYFRKDICPGVLGNVVGNGKGTKGAGAFRVHTPFGYHLPVEMGQFLQKPDILQEGRASGSRRS